MNRAASLLIVAASAVTCADARPDASPADASADGSETQLEAGPPDSTPEAKTPPTDSAPPILPDSGLAPEYAWLDDPEIWEHAPGTEFLWPRCYEFLGRADKLKFPALTWNDCGTGCAVASMDQGFPRNGRAAGISVHRLGGQVRVLLSVGIGVLGEDWNHAARQVIDLGTAKCIGGRQQRSLTKLKYAPCTFGAGGVVVPDQGTTGGAYDSETDTYLSPLTFDVVSLSWLRAEPARLNANTETGLANIYLDQGHVRLLTGKGAVYAMLDPSKHEFTTLEPNSKSYFGDGEGDLAVWIDGHVGPGQKLNGWAADGKGVRPLTTDAPATTCRVAVGAQVIVGWSTDVGCDHFGSPRFFRMPRVYESGPPITLGPVLGSDLSMGWVKTWGDYAMAQASRLIGSTFDRFMLVVRLSDWKVWRLDPTPGFAPALYAWGLSDTHVYIGERGTTANEVHETKHIRRLELQALDTWATPL